MPKDTFFNLSSEKQSRIVKSSISEFGKHSFKEAKLSNIIKASKIPRGSFYQYFEDKKDLYIFLFEQIKIKKLKYMDDMLPNPENTPFLDLFRDLYIRGLAFASENVEYVKVMKQLLNSSGELYKELVTDNLKMAADYYRSYIETDKKLGRIRDDVDTELLVNLVIDITTKIAFDELEDKDYIDNDKLLKRIDSLLSILKKGIL